MNEKHAALHGYNNSRFEEAASIYPQRAFSREEQKIHNVIHAKAIANLNEYERQGYKVPAL